MKTLLLIDGNALMHRAYHALPPLTTKSGQPTNVIYGFFNMFYKAVQDFQPQYIAICFDTPAKTFREKLYKEYQIQRPEIKDDFKVQIPILKKLVDLCPIYRAEQDGLEADDIIGTIAKRTDENVQTLILTGDKDIMQLVNSHIYVVSPQIGFSKTKLYDEVEVENTLGIPPKSIPDYKALVGDPSDNYKGAEGIGPKTAVSLIKKFKTVENLLDHKNRIENKKQREIIKLHQKDIELSKKLATIVTDADISFSLDGAKFSGFSLQLKEKLKELEMRSLLKKFYEDTRHKTPEISSSSSTPSGENQIKMF